MPKIKYAVIKDGQTLATRSSDRTYTHAVVFWVQRRFDNDAWHASIDPKKDHKDFFVPCEPHIAAVSFAGSLELARKQANTDGAEIIPVTITNAKK